MAHTKYNRIRLLNERRGLVFINKNGLVIAISTTLNRRHEISLPDS